ncbi:hypothetical protein [Hymenobacter chitinivorans]|uniref:Uncharacterized protein n=1 Tax=Hymenobacter chitinivorans DSM 11115 TaxID=1121954 RepID=A0A2M9BN80_9BACT|nr:hypothetical protein [Hymenobacter chitinivorans]PJJ59392.1 hypothetical protein CLV45_0809 [Hymenobacter chitinivorans DSM 11115]
MKDTYLHNLGFVPLVPSYSLFHSSRSGEGAYIPPTDVRYQHIYTAQDGATLFVYSWLHEPGYMLTTCENVSSMTQIVAELDSDDPSQLLHQIEVFFGQHGGVALSLVQDNQTNLQALHLRTPADAREQAA